MAISIALLEERRRAMARAADPEMRGVACQRPMPCGRCAKKTTCRSGVTAPCRAAPAS